MFEFEKKNIDFSIEYRSVNRKECFYIHLTIYSFHAFDFHLIRESEKTFLYANNFAVVKKRN